jgi:hypothetical protein
VLSTGRIMTAEQTDEKAPNRTAVAEYVAAMTADLATIARQNGLNTLGYILDMARLEAETQMR